MRCLTLRESKRVRAGPRMTLDCAHVLPASARPDLIYSPDNVYLVSREFHRRLDDHQDPLTGDPIDKNEHYWWWYRVVKASTEQYDPGTDYEEKTIFAVTKCEGT